MGRRSTVRRSPLSSASKRTSLPARASASPRRSIIPGVSACADRDTGAARSRKMADTYDLDRFLKAQEDSYETALDELKAGRKRSHWIWFIFPQLAGLGHSPTSQFYGIISLEEASAYLRHPILGG